MLKNKISDYFNDWIVSFEKHRDIMRKEIISIDFGSDSSNDFDNFDVKIRQKNGDRYYKSYLVIDDYSKFKEHIGDLEPFTVVMINSKYSLKFLLDNWNDLVVYPELIFIFINPFSLTDKRWIIKPYIHARISELSSIKTGLNAMFATVDEITEKEFCNKVRSME